MALICSEIMLKQFHTFDDWMKLAAVQALAIYIILVSSEKDRCPTMSVVLVLAVGVCRLIPSIFCKYETVY